MDLEIRLKCISHRRSVIFRFQRTLIQSSSILTELLIVCTAQPFTKSFSDATVLRSVAFMTTLFKINWSKWKRKPLLMLRSIAPGRPDTVYKYALWGKKNPPDKHNEFWKWFRISKPNIFAHFCDRLTAYKKIIITVIDQNIKPNLKTIQNLLYFIVMLVPQTGWSFYSRLEKYSRLKLVQNLESDLECLPAPFK